MPTSLCIADVAYCDRYQSCNRTRWIHTPAPKGSRYLAINCTLDQEDNGFDWEIQSWRSPYYWAGFTFQGDYQLQIAKPTRAKRDYQPFIAFGVLAVGITGLTYWYLRGRRLA